MNQERARQIQAEIREVLLKQWDPIGVADEPNAQDEYDSYVGFVYLLLRRGATSEEIATHLARVQELEIGLPADMSEVRQVADALRAIDARLDSGTGEPGAQR